MLRYVLSDYIISDNVRTSQIHSEFLRFTQNFSDLLSLSQIMPDGRTLREVIADHRISQVFPLTTEEQVPSKSKASSIYRCQHGCRCVDALIQVMLYH